MKKTTFVAVFLFLSLGAEAALRKTGEKTVLANVEQTFPSEPGNFLDLSHDGKSLYLRLNGGNLLNDLISIVSTDFSSSSIVTKTWDAYAKVHPLDNKRSLACAGPQFLVLNTSDLSVVDEFPSSTELYYQTPRRTHDDCNNVFFDQKSNQIVVSSFTDVFRYDAKTFAFISSEKIGFNVKQQVPYGFFLYGRDRWEIWDTLEQKHNSITIFDGKGDRSLNVLDVRVSHNGKYGLFQTDHRIDRDYRLNLVSLSTGELLYSSSSIPLTASISEYELSNDGEYLARVDYGYYNVGAVRHSLEVFHIRSGKYERFDFEKKKVFAVQKLLTFSEDGKQVFVALKDKNNIRIDSFRLD